MPPCMEEHLLYEIVYFAERNTGEQNAVDKALEPGMQERERILIAALSGGNQVKGVHDGIHIGTVR